MKYGIIYIAQSEYVRGVKVGKTSRRVEERMAELSRHSGVPTPYKAIYSIKVPLDQLSEYESAAHKHMDPLRISADREFFSCDPKQAQTLVLESIEEYGLTESYQKLIDYLDQDADLLDRARALVLSEMIVLNNIRKAKQQELLDEWATEKLEAQLAAEREAQRADALEAQLAAERKAYDRSGAVCAMTFFFVGIPLAIWLGTVIRLA
jgi:hypothetical protein